MAYPTKHLQVKLFNLLTAKSIREKNEAAILKIADLLAVYDPMNIVLDGNCHEYHMEARDIVKMWTCRNSIQSMKELVVQVFNEWFYDGWYEEVQVRKSSNYINFMSGEILGLRIHLSKGKPVETYTFMQPTI